MIKIFLQALKGLFEVRMKNMITALFGKIEYHEHFHYHYHENHPISEDYPDKPKNEIEEQQETEEQPNP